MVQIICEGNQITCQTSKHSKKSTFLYTLESHLLKGSRIQTCLIGQPFHSVSWILTLHLGFIFQLFPSALSSQEIESSPPFLENVWIEHTHIGCSLDWHTSFYLLVASFWHLGLAPQEAWFDQLYDILNSQLMKTSVLLPTQLGGNPRWILDLPVATCSSAPWLVCVIGWGLRHFFWTR